MSWLTLSLITLVFWGVWGFLVKLSGLYLSSKSVAIYTTLGGLIVTAFILFSMRFKVDNDPKGIIFAIIGGGIGAIGGLFFLYALAKGKASIVLPLAAMYPAMTIFLAYIFLQETLSIKQLVGIIFAFLAVFLLAG